MTVELGPMGLLATEPGDVIEDYVNGLQADGGEWTNWRRISQHDHSGGVLGLPVAITIPPGSITGDQLDPSVLAPYALTDGSKPFTGQVEMQADAVVRDRLWFGEQGTVLAPDAWWERAGVNALRTGSSVGVGVAPPASSFGVSIGKPGGTAPASYGQILDGRYNFGANIVFDGTNWNRIDVAKPAFWVDANSSTPFALYFAPAGANPIAAPATTPKLSLASTGTVTTTPDANTRGIVIGSVDGGGVPAQARYIALNQDMPSGSSPNAARLCIELAVPNPAPMGIDFHVPGVAKWGGLYMHGSGALFLGRDIGWGAPITYLSGALNWGFGRLRESGATPFIDGQNGGYLMLGGGHNGGNALSVAPANHNATHFGWGDRGWALVHSVGGLVQDSSAAVKEAITPLDPAAAMDAVRATEAVRFTYAPPAAQPISTQPYRRQGAFDWKRERDLLVQRPRAAAARTQAGFIAEQAAPLFLTGERQANPSNTAGVLLGALKNVDARVRALEGN